jgi:hypothetical protein
MYQNELKKLNVREVSKVLSNINPSVLKDCRDHIAAWKSAADNARAMADETKKKSADAKDAASEAQRDVTSAR